LFDDPPDFAVTDWAYSGFGLAVFPNAAAHKVRAASALLFLAFSVARLVMGGMTTRSAHAALPFALFVLYPHAWTLLLAKNCDQESRRRPAFEQA
jgi:hypothetical protein